MRQTTALFLIAGGLWACNNRDFPVGKRPHSVGAADLNGDSLPDLFVANEDSDDLSVLVNLGGAAFDKELRLPAGDGPVGIVAADLNNDGALDLASANFSGGFAGDVSVFLNQNGEFPQEERFPVGDGPVFLVAADFDGDQNIDLATADSNSFSVSVLFGKGDGSFDAAETFLLGGQLVIEESPKALAIGDVDQDGSLDILAAQNFGHRIAVLLNDGNGNFAPPNFFTCGSFPTSIAIQDFDQDGIDDLGIANSGSGDALVLLPGLGAGDFVPSVLFNDDVIFAGVNPVAVVAADFDEDGLPDLAAANSNSFDVTIDLNQGDGTFELVVPNELVAGFVGFPVGDGPNALAVDDFDGDGHLDVATSNSFTNDVSVLLGLGDGQLVEP